MGGSFPGPYSWKYHPWVREMLDSKASFNYAMKAAQMGVTEVGINRAFYCLDVLKRKVLYVLPTRLNAADFSKDRFDSALKLSPTLATLFTDTNTVGLKQAGAASLYIRGSRGDSNLKGLDVSELILDEVDEMDQKQIWLALTRLDGQTRKCVWAISTPTIPDYGIHKLYLTSTQERFQFKCPGCSRYTELVWPKKGEPGSIEIIGETIHDVRCHESFLKCKECGVKLDHHDKLNWLSTGTWVSTAGTPNQDVRGFYINQLYSPTVSPGELVVAFLRGRGDEAANKEFHCSKLGVPFIGDGAQVTDELIDLSVRTHTREDCRPKKAGRLITMGVDQGKTNYFTLCEWFVDQMSYDINVAAKCKVLTHGTFMEDEWYRLRELMCEWQVQACVIDADPQINEARRFAKEYPGFVFLCRYRRGKVGKEMVVSEADTGAPLVTVDRTNWMTAALGRFRTARVDLPADVGLDFRAHIKAPVRTYVNDDTGNPVATFVETGADHYAHSFVYSEIALPLAASIRTGDDITRFL